MIEVIEVIVVGASVVRIIIVVIVVVRIIIVVIVVVASASITPAEKLTEKSEEQWLGFDGDQASGKNEENKMQFRHFLQLQIKVEDDSIVRYNFSFEIFEIKLTKLKNLRILLRV